MPVLDVTAVVELYAVARAASDPVATVVQLDVVVSVPVVTDVALTIGARVPVLDVRAVRSLCGDAAVVLLGV